MSHVWQGKTYWLVGASEGLGRTLAEHLSALGVTLCLSSRSEARLYQLAESLAGPAIIAPCDVRDRESVARAFASLPPLDGVIFNAGLYEPVSATAWDAEAVEAMCDANFTGAARVLGEAVPALVARGCGHIVLIGSLAAYRGLPGSIGYGASKAGLFHLAESVCIDLPRDAFKVQIINPGFIETRLTAKNRFAMPFIMSPEKAARLTVAKMARNRFGASFPWHFGLLFRLATLIPASLYFALVR